MNLDQLAARGRAIAGRRPAAAAGAPPWFRIIRNADEDRAEVFIYGVIGSDWDDDDVTAGSFIRQLRAITAPAIDLHVNSPGGSVFDGVAIYSALLNHAATVDVHVDGVAASAASFVSMAGDSVEIEKPAKMMIHDATGVAMGNAAVMRELADLLDELSDTIAGIYADRAGEDVDHWRDLMRAETWFSADAAVEAGLADRVANDRSSGDSSSAPAATDRRSQLIRARARVHLERV